MAEKKPIIAIDGSSFVGKSTVAKALAKITGYKHINTGYMFRAIAYKMLKNNIPEEDTNKIIEITKETTMDFKIVNDNSRIIVDENDITDELLTPTIVPLASKVSVIPEVREILLQLQRKIGEQGGVILEGRDIGTNVFPNADWKFFLDAEDWKKAERANKIMDDEGKKKYPTKEALLQLVQETDKRDRTREVAPLKMAKDAIYYDNTQSPTPEQDAIVLWYYITHKKELIKNSKLLEK